MESKSSNPYTKHWIRIKEKQSIPILSCRHNNQWNNISLNIYLALKLHWLESAVFIRAIANVNQESDWTHGLLFCFRNISIIELRVLFLRVDLNAFIICKYNENIILNKICLTPVLVWSAFTCVNIHTRLYSEANSKVEDTRSCFRPWR